MAAGVIGNWNIGNYAYKATGIFAGGLAQPLTNPTAQRLSAVAQQRRASDPVPLTAFKPAPCQAAGGAQY